MDKQQFQKLQHKFAVEQATERMQDAVNTLQRSMYELELYIERLEKADSDRERSNVVNRFLTYLANGITPNIRFDLLADSQAQLAAFAAMEASDE
jgi:hypothetical protein